MRDRLGPETICGYCTNVHPGATLSEMKANLELHALAVKASICPDEPMGIGLWLSADVAAALVDQGRIEPFAAWLHERRLLPYTLNGFPYGNFHQPRVKHRVYEPDWSTNERRDYTIDLARILHALLPEGVDGSISTLPLGWPDASVVSAVDRDRAAERIMEIAHYLHHFEKATGRLIHVDIEPEPGCILQTSEDVVRFFEERLFPRCDRGFEVTRYIRVCHDICHAAVMFESQSDVYSAYDRAGIRVGKVQVSSAVRVVKPDRETLRELSAFAEDRYLHQTVVRTDSGETVHFDDLPSALAAYAAGHVEGGEWRVHFHVPLHVESFGRIATTQDEVRAWLATDAGRTSHVEVETYAWGVLPAELQPSKLADGISDEIRWLLHEASS